MTEHEKEFFRALMEYENLKDKIQKILKRINYFKFTHATVYGLNVQFTELEVRALQLLAKEAAQRGEDDFKEFTDNIIVYSGPIDSPEKHQMHFRKDGKFVEEFEKGFLANTELAWELL